MNLPLHLGFLGALEAGLIAFLVGILSYGLWRWLMLRAGASIGHAIGWACVTAAVVAGGIDAWNLFYLGMMKLESPLYARLALQGIHDAESLGARVICEVAGVLAGVAVGWQLFSGGFREKNVSKQDESRDKPD
ncbi:hypothetical protein [Pseudoxanthomonas sacheonensis]|uniref:hypothetical protein n=1 Tax=Pseudoxanthomonas sacheonensis TaxID=443615 RepID=UPI0013D1B225|nr:hypothetical protein [Pseudoxanthomonas sacheonensis]KAF1708361.1 hypothetical protein CSC73_08755 [Pseudoxanthomonas sacheonensis]